MANKLFIYTEGASDKEFIEDVLKFHFDATKDDYSVEYSVLNTKVEIKNNGNGDKMSGGVGQYFARNDSGGIQASIRKQLDTPNTEVLLILDADDSRQKCTAKLKKVFGKDSEIALYTWPDNIQSGDLETLLIKLTQQQYIINCWNQFSECLGENAMNKLHLPDHKKLIYTYCDLVGAQPKIGQRDFCNSENWNLNHALVLQFRTFLEQYLK